MTSSAPAVPKAKGFRISMTPDWWDLPLDPSTCEADIRALVAEHRPDATPELQHQMVTILTQASIAAHSLGAGLCAEYAAADEEGRLIGANLLVTEAPTGFPPEDAEDHARTMAGRGFPGPAGPPPAECSVVVLRQSGPAIRVRSNPRPAEVLSLPSLRLQFFVPVPGTGTTAVMTFSSPVVTGLEPQDQLIEFFDAMADTFCFLDEQGEPIPPAGPAGAQAPDS